MFKLLSVVVPIFRVENFIQRCAESLFIQDYGDIEFLFVNDCTPDDSIARLKEMILRYPHRNVRIINHDTNKGLSAARNTGIANAIGEYVMHVDSDDYLDSPDVVSTVMKELLKNEADMALFDMKYIYPHRSTIMSQEVDEDKELFLSKMLQREIALCVWGGIYKRSLYTDNNIWAVEGLNFGEDYAVKPRLVYMASKIVHVPNVYYCYRQDNVNSYTKNYNVKTLIDIDNAWQILRNFFSETPEWSMLWKKSLDIAAAKIFADKLLYWAASNSPKCEFEKIRLCDDVQIDGGVFTHQQRLALCCAKFNCPILLRCIVKGGMIVKKVFR